MGTEQDDEPDLMLVSTYAPVVLAVLKTTLFLASMQLLEYLSLALNLQTVIVCVILYLDYNKTRQDKFERASGFLFSVARAPPHSAQRAPNGSAPVGKFTAL